MYTIIGTWVGQSITPVINFSGRVNRPLSFLFDVESAGGTQTDVPVNWCLTGNLSKCGCKSRKLEVEGLKRIQGKKRLRIGLSIRLPLRPLHQGSN